MEVSPYRGRNPLYRRGFLKVSDNRRHLTFADGTPFLWIGDTAWAVPQRASEEEWAAYLADRVAKRFTLLQVAPAPEWAGEGDRRGEKPFTDKACSRWNPAYWQKALQWESAFQMQHLHDFLSKIEWWRLDPAHKLIRNQPEDVTRRMVLARIAASDLAVAYLPGNEAIEIDVSVSQEGLLM